MDLTDEKGLQSGQFVHGFKERTRGKHLLGSRECNFLRTGLPRGDCTLVVYKMNGLKYFSLGYVLVHR